MHHNKPASCDDPDQALLDNAEFLLSLMLSNDAILCEKATTCVQYLVQRYPEAHFIVSLLTLVFPLYVDECTLALVINHGAVVTGERSCESSINAWSNCVHPPNRYLRPAVKQPPIPDLLTVSCLAISGDTRVAASLRSHRASDLHRSLRSVQDRPDLDRDVARMARDLLESIK